MKRYHETLIYISPSTDGDEKQIITNKEGFNRIFRESADHQVMIITIVGPYQVGKSTLIKMLTNDREISTGDGTKESTKDTIIYGPYQYNEVRNQLKLQPVDSNLLLYFIDSEGIDDFRFSEDSELNKIFLDRMLTPCVALSQISIIMHRANIDIVAAKNISLFLEKSLKLIDENDSLEIINIIPNQMLSINDPKVNIVDQYKNSCTKMSQAIPHRFNGIKASKYIVIPDYIECHDLSRLSPKYYEKFMLAAKDIFESIENSRSSHKYDGSAMIEQFDRITQNIEKENFASLVQQARKEAQFGTIERIYFPSVIQIIETKKRKISQLYPIISPSCTEEDSLTTKIFNIDPIIETIPNELNEFEIPLNNKEEIIQRFLKFAYDELKQFNDSIYSDYFRKLQERQIEHLFNKITTEIGNITVETMNLDSIKEECFTKNDFQPYLDKINSDIMNIIDTFSKKHQLAESTNEIIIKKFNEMQQGIQQKLIETLNNLE